MSPQVFTQGWLFGAKAVVNPGTPNEKDVSTRVQWSGSGTFSPQTGAISRPRFSAAGRNTITLTLILDGHQTQKIYTLDAVSPYDRFGNRIYAVLGDMARCPSHSHGCIKCPHLDCKGPITAGSPTVMLKGPLDSNLPVARVGDGGVHAACCGPNTFEIVGGDPLVLIDGKPAARIGDITRHCGGLGMGTIVSRTTDPPPSNEKYICTIQEHRDPRNPNRAGWIVMEEKGRLLKIHVGNDDNSFRTIYTRVHGEEKWNSLGFMSWTRIGKDWQDAMNEAQKKLREWLMKND